MKARSNPVQTDEQQGSRLAVSNWLRLVKVYNLIFRQLRIKVQQECGCTLPQFDVLAQLYRERGGLTFVELSRRLLVTSGNLTGIADRLEKAGYVRRRPDKTDRRVIRLVLTPQGADLMAQMVPTHAQDLEEIMQALDTEQQLELRRILGKMRESLGSPAESP